MNSLKTYINVSLQGEGLHNWPDASKHVKNVDYLESIHRHIFFIKVKKKVNHNDRDVEIIEFKRSIKAYLDQKYQGQSGMWEFGAMSCEMIANELTLMFNLSCCEVLEDNENGATVELDLNNHSKILNVHFVLGYPCSGKGSYIEGLKQAGNPQIARVISVSEIVRDLSSKFMTKDLFQTISLGPFISKKIKELIIEENNILNGQVIIDGLRQFDVYKDVLEFLHLFRYNPILTFTWQDTPLIECERRFYNRARASDNGVSYLEALNFSKEIGLDLIKEDISEIYNK